MCEGSQPEVLIMMRLRACNGKVIKKDIACSTNEGHCRILQQWAVSEAMEKLVRRFSNLRQDTLVAKNVKSRNFLVMKKCVSGCKANSNWDEASEAFENVIRNC